MEQENQNQEHTEDTRHHEHPDDCPKACGEIAEERLRYFTGRLMTARDFRDEQFYHVSRRHLHNRVLHGWGVVCGLHVREHRNEACRDRVEVQAGFALDCCGREVIVPEKTQSEPVEWKGRRPDSTFLLLCLHYKETPVEPVPVLYTEGFCDEERTQFSRYREGYKLEWRWVRERDLPQYGWKLPNGGCPEPPAGDADQQGSEQAQQYDQSGQAGRPRPCPEDDCDDYGSYGRSCLNPNCPPGHCVPLALIRLPDGGQIFEGPITNALLQTYGRKSVNPHPEYLTHICEISWEHGRVYTPEQLRDELGGILRVRFDRRLQKQQTLNTLHGPVGISTCTFRVMYGGIGEDLDFVTGSGDHPDPYLAEDGCTAEFYLNPGRNNFDYLVNKLVFITLKCDFILDCRGLPVDGEHLRGELPSGDGTRGGDFESWFLVAWNRPQQQEQQPQQQLRR